eukprot:m.308329 g.308329  ORF g.308329 m.308329 type:complete len:119 (+) comp19632_c0_seq1:275-631(+)
MLWNTVKLWNKVTDGTAQMLLGLGNRLEHVALCQCSKLTATTFAFLGQRGQHLRSLDLTRASPGDEGIAAVALGCPNLETFTANSSHSFDGGAAMLKLARYRSTRVEVQVPTRTVLML